MTCAQAVADTHHRIDHPNSRNRFIKVVGLGEGGAAVARTIGARQLRGVEIVIPQSAETAVVIGTLEALADADMIFLVAGDGDDIGLAPQIRQAVRRSGILVTGILFQRNASPPDKELLAVLRTASDMLVITFDEDYLEDMLVELGA